MKSVSKKLLLNLVIVGGLTLAAQLSASEPENKNDTGQRNVVIALQVLAENDPITPAMFATMDEDGNPIMIGQNAQPRQSCCDKFCQWLKGGR